MLHHLSLGVRTIEASAAFYDAVLAALGYVRVWSDLEPGTLDQAVGYGRPGGDDSLALKQRQAAQCAPGAGFHLAFAASDASAVDASIWPRCNTAAAATARPACGRTTATVTTLRSSSIPTGTTSKRWSTRRSERGRLSTVARLHLCEA
nr:hypothetical protein [Xanthomonas arboricola]